MTSPLRSSESYLDASSLTSSSSFLVCYISHDFFPLSNRFPPPAPLMLAHVIPFIGGLRQIIFKQKDTSHAQQPVPFKIYCSSVTLKQLNIRRGVLRMEEERVYVCLNIAARRECLLNLEEAALLSKHLACSDGERG